MKGRVMKCTLTLLMLLLFGLIPARAQDARPVYEPGNGVSVPTLVRDVKPHYTPEAFKAKIQGSNLVGAVVLPDGTVGELTLLESLDPKFGLDDAALAAAKQWVFNPGTKDGKPVAVRITIRFAFTQADSKNR